MHCRRAGARRCYVAKQKQLTDGQEAGLTKLAHRNVLTTHAIAVDEEWTHANCHAPPLPTSHGRGRHVPNRASNPHLKRPEPRRVFQVVVAVVHHDSAHQRARGDTHGQPRLWFQLAGGERRDIAVDAVASWILHGVERG